MDSTRPKLVRQLKDIISQAENLKHSGNFETDAENFSKFNEELKVLLIQHYPDPLVYERAIKIPRINYKAVQHKFWYWLLFPIELVYLYTKYIAKDRYLQEVDEAKSLYSSILFLVKNDE